MANGYLLQKSKSYNKLLLEKYIIHVVKDHKSSRRLYCLQENRALLLTHRITALNGFLHGLPGMSLTVNLASFAGIQSSALVERYQLC